MKFYDAFSGIGGFRLSLESNGHECVGSCEWDEYAREVYKKNFGEYPTHGDIKEIKPEDLPDFDIISGGTPCQDFSLAGLRQGLKDENGKLTRSGMYYEFLRLISIKKPKYIILENVKGMLSHKNKEDGGYSFDQMMEALCELGYAVDFTILNAKYWIPQNRPRVFVIGKRLDLLLPNEII